MWTPDDPEYDHQDPENDGQTGRRCRMPAPRYAPQIEIRASAQGKDAQEFDRPDGSGGHPKAPPRRPEIDTPAYQTTTTLRTRDGTGGQDGTRTRQGELAMNIQYRPEGLPEAHGLYDPRNEHDACGIGFVAHIEGRRSHRVLQMGLEALANHAHRGGPPLRPCNWAAHAAGAVR